MKQLAEAVAMYELRLARDARRKKGRAGCRRVQRKRQRSGTAVRVVKKGG